jgi:hypothetical protein
MIKLRKSFLPIALLATFGISSAQNLEMEGMNPADDGARPSRGMTTERVEQKFGAPESKVAPVGDPPISRWEYPGYIVYFEYDRVIHAVARR